MRITDKDKEIYSYIIENGFATVKQVGAIFYNDIIYANELAKKRLNCLIEHGYIKQKKSTNCSQHIFYADDNFKKQTYHNIIVMDFYSKLRAMNSIKIVEFEKEKAWISGTGPYVLGDVVSDAYITIEYDGYIRSYILEVQASNNDFQKTISKYDNIRNSILEKTKCTPTIIFVDDIKRKDLKSSFPIKQIDLKLNDFPLIFDV